MFDRQTTLVEKYEELLSMTRDAMYIKDVEREKLYNRLFAIKARSSEPLYIKLVEVETRVLAQKSKNEGKSRTNRRRVRA